MKGKRGRGEDAASSRDEAEQMVASAWGSAIEQSRVSASSSSKVELEAKLGRQVEGRFLSSVSEGEFLAVEKRLQNAFSWLALPERVTTDCMAQNDMRLSFDAENLLTGAMIKKRISNATALLGSTLALRLSLSLETNAALPAGCAIGMPRAQIGVAVSLVRRKARRTFLHRSSRGVFQIDMTRVETEGASDVSLEVELEFMPWALQPHVTEHDRRVWSAGIVEFVSSIENGGQVSELRFPSFESFYLRRCDERNTPHLLELKKVLLRNFGNVDRSRIERAATCAELRELPFPGTLPKPLTRSSLRVVDPLQFKVSEKTDGSRYLMLVVSPDGKKFHHRGVFLVDRNLDFFQVHSEHSLLEEFCMDFASEGPMLLDGEVVQTPMYDGAEVFHLMPGAPVFVAFDLLAYKGFLCDEPLAKREQVLMEVTSKFFQKESAARNRGMVQDPRRMVYFPFFLNRKKLFPAQELGHLCKLLKTLPESGERLYVERDQGRLKRFHKSDGLVLTHLGPYAAGLGDFSFKWKYPELISIDFQLIRTTRHVEFHLAGNNKESICVRRDADMIENDGVLRAALIAERGAPASDPFSVLEKNRDPVIAELAFNRESGRWIFHRLREKLTPNHISVGFQTMEQIMERPLETSELMTLFGKNQLKRSE